MEKFRKDDVVICVDELTYINGEISDKVAYSLATDGRKLKLNQKYTIYNVYGEFISFYECDTVTVRKWYHESLFISASEPRKNVFFGKNGVIYGLPIVVIPEEIIKEEVDVGE